jgi:hypothetical protein
MIDDDLLIPEEHVLKGLPRLRYKKPQESLEAVRESTRRWWWEYLRISKDYWMVCQTSKPGSIQTQDQQLRRVYRRFGDIYNCTFDEWWLDRGYMLFSEQERFPKVEEVPRRPTERKRQAPAEDRIWIDVPLKLSKRTIQKQIGKLLDEYESNRLNRRLELTSADFKINPVQFGTNTLKKVHEVHVLHRELIEKPKWLRQYQPEKVDSEARADLFRIGKLLRLSPSNESLRGLPNEVRARLNRMRVAVSRLLKRSELLIANVEVGTFPSYKPVEQTMPRFNARQLEQHKELESQWWQLNLISELSADKLAGIKGIQYEEPARTRQVDLIRDPSQRRVIIRDA